MEASTQTTKITILDVADALGVSKTTVSRAISGKGRIGEKTRKRVLDYIKENDYRPNPIAKGLAESKTYNLCVAIPDGDSFTEASFFVRCIAGVAREAARKDYDILTALIHNQDISHLKRIVQNRKADGVVLCRTLVKDAGIAFLKESGIPFVTIGSTRVRNVVQVDNDHVKACKELTAALIGRGIRKIALIGGDMSHMVNEMRKKGFEKGAGKLHLEDVHFYLDCEEIQEIHQAVADAVSHHMEGIICMDDRICYQTLVKLQMEKIRVPDQIKIASFYGSSLLGIFDPPITAIQYNPTELGEIACQTLIDMVDGKEVANKAFANCHLEMTDSV